MDHAQLYSFPKSRGSGQEVFKPHESVTGRVRWKVFKSHGSGRATLTVTLTRPDPR